jgi:hypothetical protein
MDGKSLLYIDTTIYDLLSSAYEKLEGFQLSDGVQSGKKDKNSLNSSLKYDWAQLCVYVGCAYLESLRIVAGIQLGRTETSWLL